jgi:hypothetical protein
MGDVRISSFRGGWTMRWRGCGRANCCDARQRGQLKDRRSAGVRPFAARGATVQPRGAAGAMLVKHPTLRYVAPT